METLIAEIITENISLNVNFKHHESGICFSSVYIKKVILHFRNLNKLHNLTLLLPDIRKITEKCTNVFP